ncbi:MAG: putative toxin-antitoxin system toxin component, PIN family [Rhodoferax sp.]
MSEARALVLDTNLVLDIWLFDDPDVAPLRAALEQGALRWVATAHMRAELAAVLRYPHLLAVMARRGVVGADVLAAMDAQVRTWAQAAPKAPYTCRDRDDQAFIDLAVAHGALLLSKDKAVLKLTKRLRGLGVEVARPGANWP